MTAPRRLLLVLLWLGLLLAAGFWIGQQLQLSGDLRRFMPGARTPAQKLLIEELGEGPGARLLLVALSGDAPAELARQSQALRGALADSEPDEAHFDVVANGDDGGLDAVPERLRPYRYLLSATADRQSLDRAWLADELAQRVQDLGSPAADLIEPLLARDPTLEALKLAEAWQPPVAPEKRHGVWFDRNGNQALLLLETRAAGFDPAGQQAALATLREAFDTVRGDSPSELIVSGTGAFSEQIAANTRREATLFGSLGGCGFALILLLAFRRWQVPLLAALPVASAGLVGLAAVALLFADGVHGITLAFGFTLIGVAADYPIHLFSHLRPQQPPRDSARLIWRTLATGVASTCLAYLTFFVSGVDGLRQLAVFTVTGLATAALGTRFLLPALLVPASSDIAEGPRMARLLETIERLPRPAMPVVLGVAALAVAVIVFVPGTFWQNDLARLTPVPEDALARDLQLREALGAPDVRYLIAIQGEDVESVLIRSEQLRPALETLRATHVIVGYDMAARYLPSAATQRQRQARLPDPATLRRELAAALAGGPFRADAFEGFIEDVEHARTATPLRAGDLVGTPLEATLAGLLLTGERLSDDGRATALVSLAGLADPDSVAQVARAHDVQLLDLKQASESLVAEYRTRVLWALALAVLLMAGGVYVMLRDLRRTLRVLAPMLLSTVLVLALLRGLGVELNLFHLVALMLAAGLGLDYALFFDHAGGDHAEQCRTLHAVMVCAASTLLVFSLLALSSIPVLRAIGTTVALGVLFNLVLALLVTRRSALRV
ncbi:MMPL family transporter [Marilutibacter alkalisoli]|uniref:MMPL family transporter n=1 Tax=Marilutibacter alkalisoli TaxID=2591633 RepID=A0A514BN61_9GAMM|nr:MMPL family transporter [Lysobacter alkalisoli]QDH68810.1 MMPL family transporter [Lysobacter alkalisoli]